MVKISKYFQLDDFWETISSKREFKFTSPRFKKERYVFKSGAIYSGEWKGGFRDGYGEILWPDGAQYKGEWFLGKAHG